MTLSEWAAGFSPGALIMAKTLDGREVVHFGDDDIGNICAGWAAWDAEEAGVRGVRAEKVILDCGQVVWGVVVGWVEMREEEEKEFEWPSELSVEEEAL